MKKNINSLTPRFKHLSIPVPEDLLKKSSSSRKLDNEIQMAIMSYNDERFLNYSYKSIGDVLKVEVTNVDKALTEKEAELPKKKEELKNLSLLCMRTECEFLDIRDNNKRMESVS
ncbi:MAG: hypothetical protein MHMPM18_001630 [Marteilia pararefringens]